MIVQMFVEVVQKVYAPRSRETQLHARFSRGNRKSPFERMFYS